MIFHVNLTEKNDFTRAEQTSSQLADYNSRNINYIKKIPSSALARGRGKFILNEKKLQLLTKSLNGSCSIYNLRIIVS